LPLFTSNFVGASSEKVFPVNPGFFLERLPFSSSLQRLFLPTGLFWRWSFLPAVHLVLGGAGLILSAGRIWRQNAFMTNGVFSASPIHWQCLASWVRWR
jgi:hypothetical protein